jgi:hypothetical protein
MVILYLVKVAVGDIDLSRAGEKRIDTLGGLPFRLTRSYLIYLVWDSGHKILPEIYVSTIAVCNRGSWNDWLENPSYSITALPIFSRRKLEQPFCCWASSSFTNSRSVARISYAPDNAEIISSYD